MPCKGSYSLLFRQKPGIAQKNYREFINAKLDKTYKSPLREVVGSTVLGSADFFSEIKNDSLKEKKRIVTCRH